MPRADVIETIRLFRDAVAAELARRPGSAATLYGDEDGTLSRLRDDACAAAGIPRRDYERALREDPALRELLLRALDEALTEPADPGPYAEISRESPAGTPANWHVHPWNGVDPPGGVGGSAPPSLWPPLSEQGRHRSR